MKRILGYLTFLASAALAIPAGAVTWSTANDTVQTCTGTGSTCILKDTANGLTELKIRAYSNGVWQGSNAAGPVGGGWIAANNEYFPGNGYGIANTIQQAASEEQAEPQHATDNREVVDIMVIQLPDLPAGQAWDVTSFELGYARTISADGMSGSGTSAGVQMFIGSLPKGPGGSDYDFTNVCFDTAGGTCTATQKALISQLGFQDISGGIVGGSSAVQQNQTTNINSNAAGNFLIMTGRLGEGDDAFKLKSISATSTSIPQTPLPGTVALLGLGLVGLIANRRRAAARA